jgi:hypothetical protein
LNENMDGTPGSDICGATVDCGSGAEIAVTATFTEGSGGVCPDPQAVMDGECGSMIARNVGDNALADGSVCEGQTGMTSDYVSLGVDGTLALKFEVDSIQGCTVTVSELTGADDEAYEVHVCETADLTGNCIATETFPMGGEVRFDVEAAGCDGDPGGRDP